MNDYLKPQNLGLFLLWLFLGTGAMTGVFYGLGVQGLLHDYFHESFPKLVYVFFYFLMAACITFPIVCILLIIRVRLM